MKRPIIGAVPLLDIERESYWMLPPYFEALDQLGALPIMLPLTAGAGQLEQLVGLCDGFLFTGGHDVDPACYGEARLPACGLSVPARDEMELALLRAALAADKPILGICRGIQILNVALGGTLWQDLPSQRPSPVVHEQKKPYDQPSHTVSLLPGTPLAGLLGGGEAAVTSRHHQAVKELAPALRPMALAPDGLVEAVWLPGKRFVWAVQWHPEHSYLTSEDSRKIFAAFIGQCRQQP